MSVLDKPMEPAGWYHGHGDPAGTYRYWDGRTWHGRPAWPLAGVRASGPAVASSGARFGASFVDGIVAAAITVVFGLFVARGSSLIDKVVLAALLVAAVLVPLIMTSASPGKHAVGIRVVRRDTLEPIDPQTAVLRCLPLIVISALQLTPLGPLGSLAQVGIGLANIVLVLSDREARSVYDRIAGTIVVKA